MCKTFTRHHRNHWKSKASPITSWYHLSLVLLAPWLTLQVAPETECGELGQVFFQRHSRSCSSSHPCAAWNVLSCLGKLSESEISSTVQTCSSGQELQGQQELNDESPVTSYFDISWYDYVLLKKLRKRSTNTMSWNPSKGVSKSETSTPINAIQPSNPLIAAHGTTGNRVEGDSGNDTLFGKRMEKPNSKSISDVWLVWQISCDNMSKRLCISQTWFKHVQTCFTLFHASSIFLPLNPLIHMQHACNTYALETKL